MSGKPKNPDEFTKFGLWIWDNGPPSDRAPDQPGPVLGVTNLDYVLEEHRRMLYFLMEEKTHNGRVGRAQRFSFELIDAAHRENPRTKITRNKGRHRPPEVRVYRYLGLYLVRMTGSSPDDSERMWVNDEPCTRDRLLRMLEFDLSAFPEKQFVGEGPLIQPEERTKGVA